MALLRTSESIEAYAYLILSSQASARSHIVGSTASALTAQKAFLNNFKNIVNHKVDICEDIKRYQDTLSYASSKVDYSVAEGVYMLPSDMNLKIKSRTAGYNNEILVTDSGFSLGKNDMVNTSVPEMSSHKTSIAPKHASMLKAVHKEVQSKHTSAIMHEEERVALVFVLTSTFAFQ